MAQYTKSGLQSVINTNFADNNSGDITAEKLRNVSNDIIDSVGFFIASEGQKYFIPFGSGIQIAPGGLLSASLNDFGDGSGIITLTCTVSAGNGIAIDSNGEITPDLLSNGGLAITNNEIAIDVTNLPVDSNAGNTSDSIIISDASDSGSSKKITITQLSTVLDVFSSASGTVFRSDIDANTVSTNANTASGISMRSDIDANTASGVLMRTDIDANTSNIATNTSDISSKFPNASGLVLRADIDANTSSIGSNLSSINDLDTNKFPNASGLILRADIDANTSSISDKLSSASGLVLRVDIDANTSAISSNASDISGKLSTASGLSLREDIDANTAAISTLEAGAFTTASGNLIDANAASGVIFRADIDANTSNIATNTSNISAKFPNASGLILRADIDANTAAIALKLPASSGDSLQSDIDANTANIATNTSDITGKLSSSSGNVLRADIDANTAALDNKLSSASGLVLRVDIDANTAAIGNRLSADSGNVLRADIDANTANIATNTSNISGKFPNASGLILRADIDANTASIAGISFNAASGSLIDANTASGLVFRADIDANTASIAGLEAGSFTAASGNLVDANTASGVVFRADIDANTAAISGKQATLTFGISDTNAVKIDSSSVADDEYARFTANGLESRSTSEVLSDIGAVSTASGNVLRADIDANTSSIAGLEAGSFTAASGNLVDANTASGVVMRADIDANTSAIAGKQDSLTFGISNTNAVQIDSGDVADDEYARFTANGLESRSNSEVLSDIGALSTSSGNVLRVDIDANTAAIATKLPSTSGTSLQNDIDANTSAISGKQDSLTFGISNTNAVKIDSADVADDEYARFTANGLESRSNSEVLSDIGALSTSSGNVLRVDVDANTAAIAGKQETLTFGISNTNAVKIDSTSVADDEYARFTANGLESRSTSEVLSDISALSTASGDVLRVDIDANTASIASFGDVVSLDVGISNNNVPQANNAVADDDILRVNGTQIEGRSASELLSDIGALSTSSGNVLRVDVDANTAAIAGKQETLTFGISNTNAVKIDSASVADDEYARFTANGLESRSTSEVLSDIGAQASLTFGISNTNAVKIDSASVADDEYARFTANGLESRSTSEVLSDIGALSSASGNVLRVDVDANTASIGGFGDVVSLDVGISNNNVLQANNAVADDDFLRVNGTQIEGRSASEVLSDIGAQSSLTFGISNTNAVKIDSTSVADDEYARFTANGLESRSTSEVLSDIGAQASLTFGISNTNAVKIDSASVADDEYARFTANGLESRSGSEVRSDIGLGTIATQANDSVNIDGGAIDGTTIGANSAAAATFTSATINESLTVGKAIVPTGIQNAEVEPEDATVSIDLSKSNYFEVTLGANVTAMNFTNGATGQRFIIRFEQPAGANYSLTWNSSGAQTHDQDGGGSPANVTTKFPGGTAPTMTATNGKADTYGFIIRAENAFDGYVIGQNI